MVEQIRTSGSERTRGDGAFTGLIADGGMTSTIDPLPMGLGFEAPESAPHPSGPIESLGQEGRGLAEKEQKEDDRRTGLRR